MIHAPIHLDQIGLLYPHKICFENFTTQVCFGQKIAIIGANGSGKSSLLKILLKRIECSGNIILPKDIQFGYVEQLMDSADVVSGSERFQSALTVALSQFPNCLLLDEPTNHLDQKNKKALMQLLRRFEGTLIVVSHDQTLLRSMNCFWEIINGKITIFNGNYDNYLTQKHQAYIKLEVALNKLKQEKKAVHEKLMQEQLRAKKKKAYGKKKYEGDKLASGSAQGNAERTSARNRKYLNQEKEALLIELKQCAIPKVIRPSFSIPALTQSDKMLISVRNGVCGYVNKVILHRVDMTVHSKSRISILGENKSGKTTLIKAILNDPIVQKSGQWNIIRRENIGYLDQHYRNLVDDKSVFDSLQESVPHWTEEEIRVHLATFLFFKNAEINMLVKNLSGGERARLSLALIAANTPLLLILDEVTNNLDMETKEHIIQVLQEYPGALILISHDGDFLNAMHLMGCYQIEEGYVRLLQDEQ